MYIRDKNDSFSYLFSTGVSSANFKTCNPAPSSQWTCHTIQWVCPLTYGNHSMDLSSFNGFTDQELYSNLWEIQHHSLSTTVRVNPEIFDHLTNELSSSYGPPQNHSREMVRYLELLRLTLYSKSLLLAILQLMFYLSKEPHILHG